MMEKGTTPTGSDGSSGSALHRTAATLRLKFRAFASCFVGLRGDPDGAPPAPPAAALSSSSSSSSLAPPLLPDDVLREILVRLPPLPSSLPRAALVCTRWRRVLAEPCFTRRFRAHHRAPPLLGFFIAGSGSGSASASGAPAFFPALPAPDRIPAARFAPPGESWRPLGCRHGLALFLDYSQAPHQLVVWDPVTDAQRRVPVPSQLAVINTGGPDAYTGAVLVGAAPGAGDDGHLHGDGDRISAFRLVLACCSNTLLVRACLYDSTSGTWGDVCSTPVPYPCVPEPPAVLVGSTLCWLLCWSGTAILEFDTDTRSMTVTSIPSYTRDIDVCDIQVVRTDDGGLGVALQAKQCVQLWGRKFTSDDHGGAEEWVLQRTIWRDDLLSSLKPAAADKLERWLSGILGYDEDANAIVVSTEFGTFLVQLDTIRITGLFGDHLTTKCYPYAGFYTAVTGGDHGAEIPNDA